MSNLIPIEHHNQRVLTTQQIAQLYETDTDKIKQNFSYNRDRYIPGVHYYIAEGELLKRIKSEVENFDLAPNVNKLYLWTEKGALLHAKSLNTDRAWDVYSELVDTYFRAQELMKPASIEDLIIMQAQSMKELKAEVQQLKADTSQAKQTVEAIKDTIITQPDNWREELNKMFNKIVIVVGGEQFREMRKASYEELESRAGVNLDARLRNLRARMLDAGKSKTAINEACKLDVIAEDKKLREIYSKIVQELYIKHVA
jgi:molybdopterin converting factor small subunit